MEGLTGSPIPANRPSLPVMRPVRWGFLPRYLLAFAPLVILGISLATSALLSGLVEGFTTSLPGQVRTVIASMNELMEMSVILTAPVGIYLTFVIIGWTMKVTEIWTGSAVALGLSGLGGLLFATFSPDRALSPLLDLLFWLAYLIVPASIAATFILVVWAEESRRFLSYTFTGEGILIRSGIWKKRAGLIPYSQVRKVIVEQGPVGRYTHTGTIILHGMASGDPATGKDSGKEASHHPTDCLYGISDPGKVGALLEKLISLQQVVEEDRHPETMEASGRRL